MKNNHKMLSVIAAISVMAGITGCANNEASTSTSQEQSVTPDNNTSRDSTDDTIIVSSAPNFESDAAATISNNDAASAANDEISTASAPDTSSEPDENAETNTSDEQPALITPEEIKLIDPETEATVVDPNEPIPSNTELFDLVGTNLHNADSFIINCKLSGNRWDGKSIEAEHKYTLVVTRDTTYLYSTFEDFTNDTIEAYDEYRTHDDTTISTITRNGDGWWENTPTEYLKWGAGRDDLAKTEVYNLAVLRFLNPEYKFKEAETLNTVTPVRNENGNIIVTFPAWKEWETLDKDFRQHPFTGLIRIPNRTGDLFETDIKQRGNPTYTFDTNYNLKSIESDIIGSYYNVHLTLDFSNWNNVAPITLPEYETRCYKVLNGTFWYGNEELTEDDIAHIDEYAKIVQKHEGEWAFKVCHDDNGKLEIRTIPDRNF